MIPKLEVDGVSYSYHSLDGETLALDHISFDVSPGEFLAIVGPYPLLLVTPAYWRGSGRIKYLGCVKQISQSFLGRI